MKAYSNDLREKIIKAMEAGEPGTHVAKRFDVSKSFVYNIHKRYKETDSYEAFRQPGVKPKLKEDDIQKLKILVEENPSATLDELRKLGNFPVCRTTIFNTLKKLKITYKKKNLFAAEQKREDVKISREKWKQESSKWDSEKLVFLDESSIKTSMVSLYGRGLRGERVKDYVPDARWKSFSVLSSLRSNGQTEAIVYEGGLTGDLFTGWLKE